MEFFKSLQERFARLGRPVRRAVVTAVGMLAAAMLVKLFVEVLIAVPLILIISFVVWLEERSLDRREANRSRKIPN